MKDWTNIRITIAPDEDVVAAWAETYPGALSTGIRTKYTRGIDIDVRDADMAERVQQVLLNMLPSGTFLKRTGLPPKRLIPCRCTTPFSKIGASFKSPDGVVHNVEVLGDGQHSLPKAFTKTHSFPTTGKTTSTCCRSRMSTCRW